MGFKLSPLSSTQIALQRHDILHQILAHVKIPMDFSTYNSDTLPAEVTDCLKTLSAAARTCKAFSRHALTLLWWDLPSFDAILCVLSSSTKVVQHPSKFTTSSHQVDGTPAFCYTKYWTSVAPITKSERRRLKMYMQFIRTLNLRVSWPVEIAVFRSLTSARLGTPISPHLSSIYGNCKWYNMHEALLLLGGPSLRRLELDLSHLHHLLARRMPNVLARFCAVAPNVQELIARSQPYVKIPWSDLLDLENLRVLDFSTLYGSILDHLDLVPELACLEHLEEITFSDESNTSARPHSRFRRMIPCAGFKNLKKMTVIGGAWIVPMLFAGLPDLRLKELHLVGLKHGCLPPFEEIVQSCSDSLRSSLETLHIDYVLRFRHWQCAHAIKFPPSPPKIVRAVVPFFALPNIRELMVATEGICIIQDDDLLEIGHTWPKLVSLHFQHTAAAVETKMPAAAPTVLGVASLAEICPNLCNVRLPFIIPLHGNYLIEPAYVATKTRWIPNYDSLRGAPGHNIQHIDVARLAGIMWPLFGVVYHKAFKPEGDSNPLAEQWDTVLSEVARVQTNWETV